MKMHFNILVGSDVATSVLGSFWSSGAIVARFPFLHYQWLIPVTTRVEPKFTRCNLQELKAQLNWVAHPRVELELEQRCLCG